MLFTVAMIQEILLLLLLAVRASPVLMAEVSVLEGSSVTLLCGYSVKDHGYDTRWGRNCYYKFWGECGCSKTRVIKKDDISPNDPKKYSLSRENLTISNLQLKDRGSYCCCVYITSVFSRDYTEYYNLKVVKGCERNLMKGVAFGINNMFQSPPFVTNASQCRQKCTEHYNCQYFTFVGKEAGINNQNNRHLCFLMASTDDMPVTIQYLEHATSGYSLKNCSGIITYSAKKYSLVLEEKNWTEAQEYCRQHYTNLSIIHTEEDWKAIQSSLGNFIGDVWIGLHRPGSTEKWKWSDGEDFMFFNWEKGFGVHAVGHDCVLSISSHWQPVSCATQRQYMCQRVRHGNGTTEKVYELMPGAKTQQDALKDCRGKNRDLASILNQKEQEAFDEMTEGETWIGLEHNNSNTLWEWSNGESFQQWENTRGDGNCVQLNRKWRPRDCSRQSAFLCYGDEHPLNNTGDLNTPVTPETTSPTSTGPPSTEMFTTTPTTSPTTTTNGQSTTSSTTTTNGQSTTSSTTTTNGQSTTSPTTTTNGQSTTSSTTTTNGQSTTSSTTTTNGQSTTSPTTTSKEQSTTSPTITINGQSTTSPTTTTDRQSTTLPTSTSSGQLTSSGFTSPNSQPTSSPSSTTSPLHPNYLHFFNESKSWINSLKSCKSRGSKSNLVQITNQTVHADVTQLLANVELQCGEVWIGLERSIFEWNAPWLWTGSDVDKVVKYSDWHSCFPLNPINYHCGKMVRVGNGELKWLDASCHQELPFICQDLH
ncbi:C-type mannose receptor 2-like isoform X2 [Oncorhynchus keta]|uniref:C-type mannose receptor 2-like isoform X2 n=1 Tax=Oncorhynchus keta TaxID=8018 RepID=UPI00227B0FA4|nr:C-type mannose receptor 2-like isoform X2 [Oncorhynchus keta]